MKELINKNKSIILYLIFGFLTTVLNIAIYAICSKILNINYVVSNIIAWIAGVLFAYVTNKIYVFNSKTEGKKDTISEVAKFFVVRIITLILDIVIIHIGYKILKIDDVVMKCISNIIVIITNYFMSKYVVFKSK